MPSHKNCPLSCWHLSFSLLFFLCLTHQSHSIPIKIDTPTRGSSKQTVFQESLSEDAIDDVNASGFLGSQREVQVEAGSPVNDKIDPYPSNSLTDNTADKNPSIEAQSNKELGDPVTLQVNYGSVGTAGIIGVVLAIIFGPWIPAFLFGFFCALLDTSGRSLRAFWTDVRNPGGRRRRPRQDRQAPVPQAEAEQNIDIFIEIVDPSKSLTLANLETFFPKAKFEELKSSFPQTLCSVCLDAFEPEVECHQLPCEHIFHAECIELWLKSQLQKNKACCPNCNVDVHVKQLSRHSSRQD